MDIDVEVGTPDTGTLAAGQRPQPGGADRAAAARLPRGVQPRVRGGFGAYGVLLDRLAMASINGFTYHQPQPFDLPGPDGPKDPEWIGAEIGRRTGVAAAGVRGAHLARGHAALGRGAQAGVDRSPPRPRRGPPGAGRCAAAGPHRGVHRPRERDGVPAPPSQHARAGARWATSCCRRPGWTGRPPTTFLSVFDGYSPVSSVVAPEMQPALDAIRKDDDARALLLSGGDAGGRARSPS